MKRRDSSKQADPPDVRTAFLRAAALCSRQEKCTAAIFEKLGEWGLSLENREKVIQLLKKDKFLDDQRFARTYVRDKFNLQRWGRIKITHMLRQKQIGNEIISEALNEIDEDDYDHVCLEVVRQKSATLKDRNLFTRKAKLFRYASARGFEPDQVHRAMQELEREDA